MPFTNDSIIGRMIHTAHVDNLRAYVHDGCVRCPAERDPSFFEIWAPEIVQRRAQRNLPFGSLMLGRCTSFHLGPKTPAHFAIATGYGTARVRNADLVHLETSTATLVRHLIAVAVSDRNLLARDAQLKLGVAGLEAVDWEAVLSGRFAWDPNDPTRAARAAAEVIARGNIPFEAIEKLVCSNETTAQAVTQKVRGTGVPVVIDRSYSFDAGE